MTTIATTKGLMSKAILSTTTRPAYLSGAVRDEIADMDGVGYMRTPNMGTTPAAGVAWGADNGCFSVKGAREFKLQRYLGWLQDQLADDTLGPCLFATAPDKVGDAATTLRLSAPVLPMLRELGIPAALVAQDGLENLDVPWDSFDVLFIGGSTEWKLGAGASKLVAEARSRGKYVHMGRVNSRKRYRYSAVLGCDSADGTYVAFGPSKNLPKVAGWIASVQVAN